MRQWFIIACAITLLSACRVREKESYQREILGWDSLQIGRRDSVFAELRMSRLVGRTVRWEQWDYSPPDTAGRQHVERQIRILSESSHREQADGRLHRTSTDTLSRRRQSAEREVRASTREAGHGFRGWWGLAGVVIGLVAGAGVRRWFFR